MYTNLNEEYIIYIVYYALLIIFHIIFIKSFINFINFINYIRLFLFIHKSVIDRKLVRYYKFYEYEQL
jgi:hypothetical protein